MQSNKFAAAMLIAGASGVLAWADAANASMVMGYQETAPNTVTGSGTVNTLVTPGTYTYVDSFSAPQTAINGSTFGFYDDFVFSITGATANSITSTIDLGNLLGISNLQVRLYSATGQSSLPVLGAPNGGVIDGWSSSVSYAPGLTGTIDVLPTTALAAGTYVLEVRGTATGLSGGSYSGVLNLTPGVAVVPLPAALPLLLSGLGLVGASARRRRRVIEA